MATLRRSGNLKDSAAVARAVCILAPNQFETGMTTSWPKSTNAPQWEVTQPDVASLREPLLGLWQRNLPTAAEHRFDWLYGSGRARAWLLSERDSTSAGAAGLLLRRMSVAGRMVECGAAIDLNVDQTQRSVGPALTLVRAVTGAADREGREVLFGMPNRSATAVMKRAGYQELGEFSCWTKLLSSRQKLDRVLRLRWASRLVAPLADKALQLLSAEWRARLPRPVVAESLSHFDSRFDRLWSDSSRQFDVIGERTQEYLSWRFASCPDLAYDIFTLASRETGELLGYVVWYADEGAVSISDLLAVDEPTTVLLLAEFSRTVRRTKAAAIRFGCFGSPAFYRLLQRAGFHRRQNRHVILSRFEGESKTAIREGANWFLTMADSDTDV